MGTISSTQNNGRNVNIVATDGILFFFYNFYYSVFILIIHLCFKILKVALSEVSEIISDENDPDFGNKLIIFVLFVRKKKC